MNPTINLRWILGSAVGFLLINALAIYSEFMWLNALPLALIIVGFALFRLDWLMLLIVFLTPLSVSLEELQFGFGLILPTEPLMFGVMLVFFVRLFYDHKFDIRVLKHPITIGIFLNLIWILMTAITSEMPVVSFKFLLSRTWFIVTCYFLATQLFRYRKYIHIFLWCYTVPLTAVVIYTVVSHAGFGFEEKPAHWVMQPFFKDHTSYGALIAMYIPVVVGFLFNRHVRLNTRILAFMVLGVLMVGVILSYTRAAWVSLVVALGVYLVMLFRIKFYQVMIGAVTVIGFFLSFQTEIFQKLEQNRQDSSSDLTEHVESISNVATDASNLERINRWNSAIRMFEERPVFGHGPGTYMFLYAPYQHSSELTIISTNFGDGGNAHSEYFGPLAETGVLGLLTFLFIVGYVLYCAINLYFNGGLDGDLKTVLMSILLGFITYITHGTLNNFLDTDKASVPFWGFAAMIVAMDIYYRNTDKKAQPDEKLLDSEV